MGIERKGKTGKQSGESWREGVKAVQRGEKGRSCKISSFSSRSRRDSGGRARGKTNEQERERERDRSEYDVGQRRGKRWRKSGKERSSG